MRVLAIAASILLGSSLALPAQQTFIVDASGAGDFTEIQPAVDAANPGDLIRVRSGLYYSVRIEKGLRLIGEPGVLIGRFAVVEPALQVLNLPAEESLVVSNMGVVSFMAADCEGAIYLSRMNLQSLISLRSLSVERCAFLKMTSCSIFTTLTLPLFALASAPRVAESEAIITDSEFIALDGAMSFFLVDSRVSLVNCTVEAGRTSGPMRYSALDVNGGELRMAGDTVLNGSRHCIPDPGTGICNRYTPPTAGLSITFGTKVEEPPTWISVEDQSPGGLPSAILHGPSGEIGALVAGLPRIPIDLAVGTLYLDPSSLIFLHLGPIGDDGKVRVELPLSVPVELLGLPIAFQALTLGADELRLSEPGFLTL